MYWIANYTGENLEYFVEEGKFAEKEHGSSSVVHMIPSGSKLPLKLSRSIFKVIVCSNSLYGTNTNC